MTNYNHSLARPIISKADATPTQIEAFKARTNKKDSFTRWYQKNGSI